MQKLIFLLFMSLVLFACNEECDAGFEGDDCTEIRAKFIGSYSSTSDCDDANGAALNPNWSVENAADINDFILEASSFFDGIIFTATLTDSNNATIEPFQPGTDNEITGTVAFVNDSRLTLTLNVPAGGGGSVTCTFDLTN